jgi:hypothetical protein
VSKKDTRQRNSLPSVKNKTLGKELLRRVFSFTEGFLRGTRQRTLCRVPEIKHSAKNLALGKEPNSGSGRKLRYCLLLGKKVKNRRYIDFNSIVGDCNRSYPFIYIGGGLNPFLGISQQQSRV